MNRDYMFQLYAFSVAIKLPLELLDFSFDHVEIIDGTTPAPSPITQVKTFPYNPP